MDLGEARKFYIDGRWVAPSSGATLAVVDPASELVIGSIAAGTAEDVDAAVTVARKAFVTFSVTPVEERRALLSRIAALMEARSEELALAMTAEMGTAIGFARASQVPLATAHLRAMVEVMDRYDFLVQKGTTAIVREPVGVRGLITPWNWPLYQITAKLAPALAAGARRRAEAKRTIAAERVAVRPDRPRRGNAARRFQSGQRHRRGVGAAIAAHPEIDTVSITGSVRAGVLVAQAAAVTVKRVAQELGASRPISCCRTPISKRRCHWASPPPSAMSGNPVARRRG